MLVTHLLTCTLLVRMGSGRSLEWLWTAVSPASWPGLPAAGVSGQQLFVAPPVLAVHGQTIALRVFANYANGELCNYVHS